MNNRTLIMTGATGAAITGFCLGCSGPGSANLAAVLGVPISASALASLGLPTWAAWTEYLLQAIMVLFLSLAGYGLYRQRRETLTVASRGGGRSSGENDVPEACKRGARDWVARGGSLALGWVLPGLALIGSLFVESPWRGWIWVSSLLWMGAACTVNAIRCGRTHCYFTGPFFLLMACVPLFYGLGVLALGPRPWTWLGLGLVIGTAGLWWGSERLWGRFVPPRRLK